MTFGERIPPPTLSSNFCAVCKKYKNIFKMSSSNDFNCFLSIFYSNLRRQWTECNGDCVDRHRLRRHRRRRHRLLLCYRHRPSPQVSISSDEEQGQPWLPIRQHQHPHDTSVDIGDLGVVVSLLYQSLFTTRVDTHTHKQII